MLKYYYEWQHCYDKSRNLSLWYLNSVGKSCFLSQYILKPLPVLLLLLGVTAVPPTCLQQLSASRFQLVENAAGRQFTRTREGETYNTHLGFSPLASCKLYN